MITKQIRLKAARQTAQRASLKWDITYFVGIEDKDGQSVYHPYVVISERVANSYKGWNLDIDSIWKKGKQEYPCNKKLLEG